MCSPYQQLKYDPDFNAECAQTTARTDHRLDIEKINSIIMLSDLPSIMIKIEEESKNEETTNENSNGEKKKTDPAQGSSSGSTSSSGQQKITSQNFKMKTQRFDSSLPVENWISALELFRDCSGLSEENLITVSLTELLQEESGNSILEAISDNEKRNWTLFKLKLIQVLGKDREHFKHMFNTFQRGSESQAMALTKINAFFKKGYGKTTLDKADEELLCEKFIGSQEPRLRELLSREKSLLNLRNIAQRATELDRSFHKENIFTADENHGKQNSEVSQLCSQLKQLVSQAIKPEQKKAQKKKGRIDTKKIDGHCIAFVRKGTCRFGSKCRYLHSSEVPDNIRALINKEE